MPVTAPTGADRRASRRDWSTSARAAHTPRRAAPTRGVARWPVRARRAGSELQKSRAASATHGSPDVFGRWRGHGLRTDRAANLVQLRGVRYRESCPAKTVPSGKWVRTQNRAANSVQTLDRASLRRGLRLVRGSAHQLFRCHICQGLSRSTKFEAWRWCHIASGKTSSPWSRVRACSGSPTCTERMSAMCGGTLWPGACAVRRSETSRCGRTMIRP